MIAFADSARRGARRQEVCIEALAWTTNARVYGVIGDISTSGCRFVSGEAMAEGSEMHMSFELPNTDALIRCDARAVWLDRKKGVAGLQFLRMNDSSRRQLTHWLNNHMSW